MMDAKNFKEISEAIFAQYRAVFMISAAKPMTDHSLLKAVTANENLKAYGYCLKPEDIIKLAENDDSNIAFIYKQIIKLIGDVKADPMYPDFPNQVMNMDEAEMKMHQMIHYFSTYGVESLFGVNVSKGWLPDVTKTEKTESDDDLFKDKRIVRLFSMNDMAKYIITDVLSKRERMTEAETKMIAWAYETLPLSEYPDIKITFKENMLPVFSIIFNLDVEDIVIDGNYTFVRYKVLMLKSICQHTGDVLKMLEEMLNEHDWHFTTHQKKVFIYLFEEFSEFDFEENLIYSLKRAKSYIKMFEFLSYNRYSKRFEHKRVVARLRNGELKSWYSKIEAYIEAKDYTSLIRELSNRPGILFRSIARLIRIGVPTNDIYEALKQNVETLSMQTLLSTFNSYRAKYELGLNKVTKEYKGDIDSSIHDVIAIISQVIYDRIGKIRVEEFENKKVYLDLHDYSLFNSELHVAEKTNEASYVRTGIAYRIPDEVNRLRFFCYWNDEERVDLDLHARALGPNIDKNIGWTSIDPKSGMIYSGDITHSDAAEYIDVDMTAAVGEVKYITLAIDSYTGQMFSDIDEVFCGMMAVNNIGENVRLYDPKNCFWTHYLNSTARHIDYAYIDLEQRVIVFKGNGALSSDYSSNNSVVSTGFNLGNYLTTLLLTNHAGVVDEREEADVVITLGTTSEDNEISLIENNFFMDR